jgi:gliding motility-associated lipoprotein GldH
MPLKLYPSIPVLFSLSVIALISCNSVVYEKEHLVKDASWLYSDTMKFDFEIADTIDTYSMLLDVKHEADYGFQNLYVKMLTTFPSGKNQSQVLSLELAGASGVWLGKCASNKCKLTIPLRQTVKFPEAGNYTLAIEQFMRQDSLPKIYAMKLKIEKD